MAVMITDPEMERVVRADREFRFPNNRDEVWDGVLVMPPLPNNEHQDIVMGLTHAFYSVVDRAGGATVHPGANVSDRDTDWMSNYREPDAVVYLPTNPAKNLNTHWVGGPDFGVEVVSPGEDPRAKLGFYAKVDTRELLVVDRFPWVLELYRHDGAKLGLVGHADLTNNAVLASSVLPLSFQLIAGSLRPQIVIRHTTSGQSWVV